MSTETSQNLLKFNSNEVYNKEVVGEVREEDLEDNLYVFL